MPITWDQIPLEMREEVVSKMDVKTRVNLSMCSKAHNQLARGTKNGKVKSMKFEGDRFQISFILDFETNFERRLTATVDGSSICYNKMNYSTYRHVSARATSDWGYIHNMSKYNWKQTIRNIRSLIGTNVTVESLILKPDEGFQELFNWFRNNFHITPQLVEFWTSYDHSDYYDESIFDWPLNTKIMLDISYRPPNLERFNAYDKVVTLHSHMPPSVFIDSITDEDLKKNEKCERC